MSVPPTLSGSAIPAALLLPLPPAAARHAHVPHAPDRVAVSPAAAAKQLETLLPILADALRRPPGHAPLGHLARATAAAARLVTASTLADPAEPPVHPAAALLRDAATLLRRSEQHLQPPPLEPDLPPAAVSADPNRAWALAQTLTARTQVEAALAELTAPRAGRPLRARVSSAVAVTALPSSIAAFGALLACLILLLLAGAWTASATLGGAVSFLWAWRRLRLELDR